MKNQVKRNENNKLYNDIKCGICKNGFRWVEEENADVVVEKILYNGNEDIFLLEVIAKCPHCGYKVKYRQELKDYK